MIWEALFQEGDIQDLISSSQKLYNVVAIISPNLHMIKLQL